METDINELDFDLMGSEIVCRTRNPSRAADLYKVYLFKFVSYPAKSLRVYP